MKTQKLFLFTIFIILFFGCESFNGKDGADGKSYISYGSDGYNTILDINYILTIEDPNYENYWDFNLVTLETYTLCSELPMHEINPGTYHYTLEIWDSLVDTLMNSYATIDGYNTPLIIAENELGTDGEIGMVDGEDGRDWFYAFIVTSTGIVNIQKEPLDDCMFY